MQLVNVIVYVAIIATVGYYCHWAGVRIGRRVADFIFGAAVQS